MENLLKYLDWRSRRPNNLQFDAIHDGSIVFGGLEGQIDELEEIFFIELDLRVLDRIIDLADQSTFEKKIQHLRNRSTYRAKFLAKPTSLIGIGELDGLALVDELVDFQIGIIIDEPSEAFKRP